MIGQVEGKMPVLILSSNQTSHGKYVDGYKSAGCATGLIDMWTRKLLQKLVALN